MPRVSVVIPTKDRAATLGRTLSGVLAQTFADFEVVIVDDGSTDATERVVGSFKDARIRYERKAAPHGVAAARNHALSLIRSPLVAFQDAGDDWLPEKLAVHVSAMSGQPADVAMVYSSMARVLPGGLRQNLDCPVFHAAEEDTPRRALAMGVSGIFPQATLIRAEVLRELRFDEAFRVWSDMELFLRLAQRLRLQFVPGRYTLLYDDTRGVSLDAESVADSHRKLLAKHAAALGSDEALLVPHYRAVGRKLLGSSQGALARELLRKTAFSSQARASDYAWLALSYAGRPVQSGLKAARRALWALTGRPPVIKTNQDI